MKICIIGTGVCASAVVKRIDKRNKIVMWTEKDDIGSINVPDGVSITNSYDEALRDAKIIFMMTGTKFVKSVVQSIEPLIDKNSIVVLGSKGLLEDGSTPLDAVTSLLENPCAILSGPTFAVDIANSDPVGFTLATTSFDDFEKVASVFTDIYLEYSSDSVGIEYAGSLKNAYAIGSGILNGLGYGPSTNCLYIARVLNEVTHILEKLGGKLESAYTLAGVGDMVLTSTSSNSRNFTFGKLLSTGMPEQIKEYLDTTTVEGYENLRAYNELFALKGIDAPLLETVFKIAYQKENSKNLVDMLLK